MRVLDGSSDTFWDRWGELRATASRSSGLFTRLDVEYLKNYPEPWQGDDASFLLLEGDRPAAGALMAARRLSDGDVELSAYGRPILFLENPAIARSVDGAIYAAVKERIAACVGQHAARWVVLQCAAETLDPFGRALLDAGARAFPAFAQVVDLRPDEAGLRRQLRDSYRSLINWGLKNLCPTVFEGAAVTSSLLDEYRQLHRDAAGRDTRSRRTWEVNGEMAALGEAFLVLGRLDGRLVTGGFFNHDGRACYYSNGASDRSLFERPLAHCVLWRAMLHAKTLGCTVFETGQVLFAGQPFWSGVPSPSNHDLLRLPTDKELGICRFKRGFGGETRALLDIVWRTP